MNLFWLNQLCHLHLHKQVRVKKRSSNKGSLTKAYATTESVPLSKNELQ